MSRNGLMAGSDSSFRGVPPVQTNITRPDLVAQHIEALDPLRRGRAEQRTDFLFGR